MSKHNRESALEARYEKLFVTQHLHKDLKNRSARGGVVTLLSQFSKFIVNILSTLLLARLLSPEDYGLIGMVSVFVNFIHIFKDLGLSTATVQKAEINHRQVSTLFWINILMSCLTSLIVIGLAPIVAWFYKEPRLTWITLALSINFIFSGLTVQHQALLRRQMHFSRLAWLEIASLFLGIVAGIVSACLGLSYWSLVIMQLVGIFINAVGVWLVCPWRPGLPDWNCGIQSMLTFGGSITGFSLLNYFSRNLDNLLIGHYLGVQELGLYTKAYQLLLLPISQINAPISGVALPLLSRLQAEPERFRRAYRKAVLCVTAFGMPIVGFMVACSGSVVLLVLGPQWLDAVPIFRWLSLAAFIGTFNIATGWVYRSLGTAHRQLRWGIFDSSINVIVFLFSVHWGTQVLAAAYGVTQFVLLLPRFSYCYRNTPLRLSDFIEAIYRPMTASLAACGILITFNSLVVFNSLLIIQLLNSFLIYLVTYLGIWMILPNGKLIVSELFHLAQDRTFGRIH